MAKKNENRVLVSLTCEECKKWQLDWCITLEKIVSIEENKNKLEDVLDIDLSFKRCIELGIDIYCKDACKMEHEEIAKQKRIIIDDFVKRHQKGDENK